MSALLTIGLWLALGAGAPPGDPRALYDVGTYRLDLALDPEAESIAGTLAVGFTATASGLDELVLDMHASLRPTAVRWLSGPVDGDSSLAGETLRFRHEDNLLACTLPFALEQEGAGAVVVEYTGNPRARNGFDGFHWKRTESGQPWIATSCQGLGAHTWWPCKASFYHPEDKPERVFVHATVPADLVAVSNGRLVDRTERAGRATYRWRLDYPCETYAVTLNVAPYVLIAGELELSGLDRPVPYAWYVLPESEERARLQFAQVPALLDVFGRAFGPWPFPEAKVGLVQTSFWGMEHTTAIAYGSSFPAWIAEHGGRDPYAARNRWFDYILVHELAHEWWGNAVSAPDWGDFWIHEGFATYAEGVWVEATSGREAADRFFLQLASFVHPVARLYRGRGASSKQAYASVIYNKGGCVLNTLRHYLDDDETWWRTLRAFQSAYRYGNAGTEDFRAELERESGRSWKRFFEQWVYGAGYPRLEGRVQATASGIEVAVSNPAGETAFDVPLDLAWTEGGEPRRVRLQLAPGANAFSIPCRQRPEGVEVVHLERVLGKHDVRVE